MDSLGLFGFDTWKIIVPSLIIIAGVWLLFPRAHSKVVSRHYIRQTALFSGASIACDSEEFKGAELFAAFGGIDLDLRKAVVGLDKPAKIDIFVAFGGIDLIVAEGCKVVITGIPLFGGWSNNTHKNSHNGEADMVINALVLFGGLDVKAKL
jgi:hypothetical protein